MVAFAQPKPEHSDFFSEMEAAMREYMQQFTDDQLKLFVGKCSLLGNPYAAFAASYELNARESEREPIDTPEPRPKWKDMLLQDIELEEDYGELPEEEKPSWKRWFLDWLVWLGLAEMAFVSWLAWSVWY